MLHPQFVITAKGWSPFSEHRGAFPTLRQKDIAFPWDEEWEVQRSLAARTAVPAAGLCHPDRRPYPQGSHKLFRTG